MRAHHHASSTDLRFSSRLLPTSSLPGCPTKIQWKPFYNNLPPPPLRGPGGFAPEELPILRKNRVKAVEAAEEEVDAGPVDEGPGEAEVEYYFKMIQTKMKDRFAEVRRPSHTPRRDARH